MPKKTVQDLILAKLDSLEAKLDTISTKTIPEIIKDVAVTNQEIKDEAKMTSRVWGLVTLLVSICGVVIAYIKH